MKRKRTPDYRQPAIECTHCGIRCKCVRPALDEQDAYARRKSEFVSQFFQTGGKMVDLKDALEAFNEANKEV